MDIRDGKTRRRQEMNSGTRTAAIIAIIVILAASAVTLTVTSDDMESDKEPLVPIGETRSITYVLNGGTMGENPTEYIEGVPTTITPPKRDGYVFAGWYLDPDLTVYFEGITYDTTGDLVLYADWSETLEGHGFTLRVDGKVSDGLFNSYSISGEVSYRYLYYDADKGRYYMNLARDLDYIYSYTTHSVDDEKDYWSDESSQEYTEERLDDATIDTVNGEKDCAVFRLTYEDGSTETQWIGDGWIPYLIVYSQTGFLSSSQVTYTFVEELEFIPDVRCEITAYGNDDITVSGGGTFNPGDRVTLVASGDGFTAWTDTDGDVLSRDPTYTFTVGGSDMTLFAENDKDPDITAEKDVPIATLSAGTDVDSAKWYVTDIRGNIIATTDSVTFDHTFTATGDYTVFVDATSDGTDTHRFWTVSVNGDTPMTYTWMYAGKQYSTTLYIDYADYKYYRDLTPVADRHQDTTHVKDSQYVTYDDKYILQLASEFRKMTSEMTDLQRANFVLAFTQYIEYQSDEVFVGYEEYWKYPVETLFDQGGDCEDTSILYCAIAEAMGYNTALLLFPGHMAAGIDLDNGSGTYFRSNGYTFYYCETTATGYNVGNMPTNVSKTATVVRICSNAS